MTPEQIRNLTNKELTEKCATEVLKWTRTIHMRPGEWIDENDTEHWEWTPIEDWNCTMMVKRAAEKLTDRYIYFNDYLAFIQESCSDCDCYECRHIGLFVRNDENIQRAICELALLLVTQKKV